MQRNEYTNNNLVRKNESFKYFLNLANYI